MQPPRALRALRGAILVTRDDPVSILDATRTLLEAMCAENGLVTDDIVSVLFATTEDLSAEYPARALRGVPGWEHVPLLCTAAMSMGRDLPRCLRVLMHVQTSRSREELRPVYLRGAEVLRPDLLPPNGDT